MNKSVFIAILFVALVGGGIFVSTDPFGDDEATFTPADESVDQTKQQETSATTQPLTPEEVANHSSSDDCWTIVSDDVYDITEYVPRHPGGDEILRACGSDGTSLFQTRTTAEGETVGSGEPHSTGAAAQLEELKLGALEI